MRVGKWMSSTRGVNEGQLEEGLSTRGQFGQEGFVRGRNERESQKRVSQGRGQSGEGQSGEGSASGGVSQGWVSQG